MGNQIIPMLVIAIDIIAVGIAVFFTLKEIIKPSPENKGDNTANSKVDTAENSNSDEKAPDSTIKTKINIPSNSVPSKKEGTSNPDNVAIALPKTAPQKNGASNIMVNSSGTSFSAAGLPKAKAPVITVYGKDYDDSDNSDPNETIDWSAAFDVLDKAIPKADFEYDRYGHLRSISPKLACNGGEVDFPDLWLNSDENWGYLYLSAQYLNYKHYDKCVEYAGLAISASNLVVKDLRDIVSCLKLKDFPDVNEFPRDNRYAYFYDIHTKEKIDVIDTITQDTRNISDESLERLGMYIKITKPNSDDFTIFKVPFKNSLQKKIVIRYLQARLTIYASARLCPESNWK